MIDFSCGIRSSLELHCSFCTFARGFAAVILRYIFTYLGPMSALARAPKTKTHSAQARLNGSNLDIFFRVIGCLHQGKCPGCHIDFVATCLRWFPTRKWTLSEHQSASRFHASTLPRRAAQIASILLLHALAHHQAPRPAVSLTNGLCTLQLHLHLHLPRRHASHHMLLVRPRSHWSFRRLSSGKSLPYPYSPRRTPSPSHPHPLPFPCSACSPYVKLLVACPVSFQIPPDHFNL